MRTTFILDLTVVERINRIASARGQSMEDIVNEALREGFKVIEGASDPKPERFIIKAHDFRVRPGIDLDRIGRLADDLEDERFRQISEPQQFITGSRLR